MKRGRRGWGDGGREGWREERTRKNYMHACTTQLKLQCTTKTKLMHTIIPIHSTEYQLSKYTHTQSHWQWQPRLFELLHAEIPIGKGQSKSLTTLYSLLPTWCVVSTAWPAIIRPGSSD